MPDTDCMALARCCRFLPLPGLLLLSMLCLPGNVVQANNNAAAKRLQQIPGIGPITATALVCAIGDGKQFKRGRDLAAWLGLTPRQHSTGGKECLLGISIRGDTYLRTLLIHGARAVLKVATKKDDPRSCWIQSLCSRRNKNIAAVALANKNPHGEISLQGGDGKISSFVNAEQIERV